MRSMYTIVNEVRITKDRARLRRSERVKPTIFVNESLVFDIRIMKGLGLYQTSKRLTIDLVRDIKGT